MTIQASQAIQATAMDSPNPKTSQIVIVIGQTGERNGGGTEDTNIDEASEEGKIYQQSVWYFNRHNRLNDMI